MSAAESLHQLARDLGHAATEITPAAGSLVKQGALAVETVSRAVNLGGGVAVVMAGETTAVISSTQPAGVFAEGGGTPIVSADTAGLAGGIAAGLAGAGVNLITKGHQ